MTLLQLDAVNKSYRHGRHTIEALKDVSLELDPGELVAVWGERNSGRSTLLRVAAGIEAPDTGTIHFNGHKLARVRGKTLPPGIAYCKRPLYATDAPTVLDHLLSAQLARGLASRAAKAIALEALERAGMRGCALLPPSELTAADAAKVTIATALCLQPTLLLVDEPTTGVDLLDRDPILELLRSLARDHGIAILTCVAESAGLFGVDRALTISNGQLHGETTPYQAPVVELGLRESA